MTLTELADQITTKLSDTETASVTTCKKFINNRYRMLWEGGLWTNSLGVVTKAVSAEDETLTLSGDPTIFYYPTSATVASTAPRLEFVVATRFTETGKVDGLELIGSSGRTPARAGRTLPTLFRYPLTPAGIAASSPSPRLKMLEHSIRLAS